MTACKHLFKYLHPPTSKKPFLVSKFRNVQRCGAGVFHLLAFFEGSVKVNCHNWPIIEHTRRGIPEWGIGINAYRLHYFFSLQLTRCVRATFLDLPSILVYYRALDSETSTTTFSIISSANAWENVILAGKPHSGCHSTMSFSENVVVAETSCEIALRGYVTSFLWKWKLHDFAFKKPLVGHIFQTRTIVLKWVSS